MLYIQLCNKSMEKNVGRFDSYNLWSALFSYVELTINMRQQGDNIYKNILLRIGTGVVTYSDTKLLESTKLNFKATNCNDRVKELCDYMLNVGCNTVCLLPTCVQSDVLNAAMLCRFQ